MYMYGYVLSVSFFFAGSHSSKAFRISPGFKIRLFGDKSSAAEFDFVVHATKYESAAKGDATVL